MVKYASMKERFYAFLMDIVFISGLSFIIGLFFSLLNFFIPFLNYSFFKIWWCIIPGIILIWLYFALLESSKMQATIGKSIIGLKVTDLKFKRITFLQATKRFFFKIFSITINFNSKGQALHDKLSESLVIKE